MQVVAPQPGIEPIPPVLEAQSPKHCTTTEVPSNANFQSLPVWQKEMASQFCFYLHFVTSEVGIFK